MATSKQKADIRVIHFSSEQGPIRSVIRIGLEIYDTIAVPFSATGRELAHGSGAGDPGAQHERRHAGRNDQYPTGRTGRGTCRELQNSQGQSRRSHCPNLPYALLTVGIYQAEGKPGEALTALEAIEETFGAERPVAFSKAALLRETEGNQSTHAYLLEQWEASGDTGLMPSLISLANTQAPGMVDELTSDWAQAAPDSIAGHMARADWLMINGQEIVAANHYEQVIAKQPNNVAALNNLAWLLREDNKSRALELATRARELAPESAAVLDTYGWVLHLSGRHSEAKPVIEKALSLAPDSAEIQAHLEAIQQAM